MGFFNEKNINKWTYTCYDEQCFSWLWKNSDVSSNITSKEIAKKLIEADYLISPKEVDSDMVEEVYHLNLDDVENYAIYETERRPGPGFIMIVKAKDGKVENVKNSMEKVLEDKVGQAFIQKNKK